ncbi:unnamed protein product [Adineta ricciae]|uniref:Fucosyltransferase n=1 Tax=Adineta ricciae TaxID=249248 RepID=A0A815RZ80_ADIRI|nr:unnamed protein product [Adineta ricciae]
MFFRLRFILVRSCVISLVIVVILQGFLFVTNELYELQKTKRLLRAEAQFWQELAEEDQGLTDQQRIRQIELIKQSNIGSNINWTKVFSDNYRRKLLRLNERESHNMNKYRFRDIQENVSQDIFDVFEETLVFARPKFCSSSRVFHPQCPYTNCRWSCEKPSKGSNNFRRASVFHHVDINETEMHEKLQHRSYKDIWILWIDEANQSISHLNQYKFNWTLSFRQDSEVSIGTYGILVVQDETKISSKDNVIHDQRYLQLFHNRNIHLSYVIIENRILLNYRYRQKHALWLISNCSPQRRLKYYSELKKFYPIVAYGNCMTNKCDRNDQCEYKQSHLALFYLSFESQQCQDYVTEKFWRALQYGMIPIVLGPSKQSYLDLGVPNSAFIHTDDYPSPEKLADHLRAISTDYFLYRKYFQWLLRYEAFYEIDTLEPIRMCELCMRLNLQDYQEHSFYTDVHEWHRASC